MAMMKISASFPHGMEASGGNPWDKVSSSKIRGSYTDTVGMRDRLTDKQTDTEKEKTIENDRETYRQTDRGRMVLDKTLVPSTEEQSSNSAISTKINKFDWSILR